MAAGPAAPPRPRVLLFGLGGTIAMAATAETGGVIPTLTAHHLAAAAVPSLADVNIDVVDLRDRPGASLTFDDIDEVVAQVRERLGGADAAAGVVVTQGTDTIEETAYLLDLLLGDRPEPVVVTGAMRNPTLAGADGPANLLAAVRVAASPQARGLGCLVVVNDEIHAAARVRKSHSTSTATFVSPNGGPLGYVVEGVPHVLNRPIGRAAGAPVGTIPAAGRRPRVGLYTATLGDDAEALSALAARLDGLVVAGFGAGHVRDTWVPALTDIAARIPVVLASRTGAGPVLAGTYGFPGSERDLIGRGLVPAGWLSPYKARILLYVVLATGADRRAIDSAFRSAGLDGALRTGAES